MVHTLFHSLDIGSHQNECMKNYHLTQNVEPATYWLRVRGLVYKELQDFPKFLLSLTRFFVNCTYPKIILSSTYPE